MGISSNQLSTMSRLQFRLKSAYWPHDVTASPPLRVAQSQARDGVFRVLSKMCARW